MWKKTIYVKHVKQENKPEFHLSKGTISKVKPLELLHFELLGTVSLSGLGRKNYYFVIVDNFSKYTWTIFLINKDETFESFANLAK